MLEDFSDTMHRPGRARTTEHRMLDSDPLKFNYLPRFVMCKETMEIKDVVRETLLPFLPAKSLAKFKSVSKEWNQWIKSPLMAFQQSIHFKDLSGFFTQNEERYPTFVSLDASAYGVPTPHLEFLPRCADILSSCNGLLVCEASSFNEQLSYYICNPANEEWALLPTPPLYHGLGVGLILAFEPSARNIDMSYQLICAVPMFGELWFEHYTSQTKSWTVLDTTLIDMEELSFTGNGFYVKGMAYWLTNKGVIAFDVETGMNEVIPLPCSSDGVLTQIRGELCYITMDHFSRNKYHISIHGGIGLRVKRIIGISIGEGKYVAQFKVLPCFDGEKVMILFEDCIYSYNVDSEILKEECHVGWEFFHAGKCVAYVNSLVQLPKENIV